MRALLIAAAVLLALLALPALAGAAPRAQVDPNPCITALARQLRCPDLVMKRPFRIYTDRKTRRGRTLLRAGNSIDSVGLGPAELHGVRSSARYMRARQGIYRRRGGRITLRTGARLQFKYAHQRRRYWKFLHAAGFELWRLDSRGRRTRRVRTGPKVSYCLRDLRRTRRMRRSPGRRVYPACSTDPHRRRVTLGTSVGWSDIYPATYPEQWIDVTGLRGCFSYEHTADPRNGIYESNEDNNMSRVIVRLPFRQGVAQRCPGGRRAPLTGGAPEPSYP